MGKVIGILVTLVLLPGFSSLANSKQKTPSIKSQVSDKIKEFLSAGDSQNSLYLARPYIPKKQFDVIIKSTPAEENFKVTQIKLHLFNLEFSGMMIPFEVVAPLKGQYRVNNKLITLNKEWSAEELLKQVSNRLPKESHWLMELLFPTAHAAAAGVIAAGIVGGVIVAGTNYAFAGYFGLQHSYCNHNTRNILKVIEDGTGAMMTYDDLGIDLTDIAGEDYKALAKCLNKRVAELKPDQFSLLSNKVQRYYKAEGTAPDDAHVTY